MRKVSVVSSVARAVRRSPARSRKTRGVTLTVRSQSALASGTRNEESASRRRRCAPPSERPKRCSSGTRGISAAAPWIQPSSGTAARSSAAKAATTDRTRRRSSRSDP
ncbi:MAG: hypothetical protein M5U28_50490 [Sandaracinaceae bacterium]|nr:hypothetical protein [Sandaracinaceae bacterium]